MLESMVRVGRSLLKFPKECPDRFAKVCIIPLASGEAVAGSITPLVQVIGKKMAKENAKDTRTLLRISDGRHYILAILAPDLKDPVEGSVIQLLEWTNGTHEGLPAILVEDWDQSSPETFRILGQPVGVPTIQGQGGQSGQGLGSSIVSKMCAKAKKDREGGTEPMKGILFFALIHVKKTYEINGASVKQANARFCRYPMELTLDERWATVTLLPEDGSIPAIPYKFVPITELSHAPFGSCYDVIAVVQSMDEPVTVVTRSNGPRMKRQVILMDDSGASIAMNLWGEKAQCGKKCQLLELGWTLCMIPSALQPGQGSFLEANPDDPRAFKLQAWYQNAGSREDPRKKRNIAEALAEARADDALLQAGAGMDRSIRTVNFHKVSATVVAVRNERAAPFYWGCTTEVENGQCAAGHICPEPAARFNLFLQVADAFATVHCRAFGAEAEMLADVPAAEVAVLEDERMAGNMQAEKTYTRIFRNMFRRWTLTLKCRKENYEGRPRVQVSVERCSPVDYVADGFQMAHEIRRALCM
eukprot:symbB.v1.2.016776.t1/scaffold1201.1/size131815/8